MMSTDSAPHLSATTTIALPWGAPSFAAVKGIIHAPGAKPTMKPESRMLSSPSLRPQGMGRITISGSAALPPLPKLSNGRSKGERHIRLFAPPTFLGPHIIPAIVDGAAPADLTVTSLARALPYSQIQQERVINIRTLLLAGRDAFF
jgi:hypothetical protein